METRIEIIKPARQEIMRFNVLSWLGLRDHWRTLEPAEEESYFLWPVTNYIISEKIVKVEGVGVLKESYTEQTFQYRDCSYVGIRESDGVFGVHHDIEVPIRTSNPKVDFKDEDS
jgi:hypothetical protein